MTKFWGVLFGINFALGVATGITMEFQFGMNWAYYSHYVGDIFGAPLAIEGLMAFFLEATFVGLFFFGWDKLSARAHLVVTWLVALGTQPLGAVDPDRQRLDAESGRRGLQSRHDAHGSHRLHGRAVQPGRAGEVRPHRFGRLCLRRRLRARRFGLVHAARPACRTRQALLRHRRGLRRRLGAVGHRAGRRERLRDHRQPEDEARRHGGDVGDRARAGLLHRVRHPRAWPTRRRISPSTFPG